MFLKIVLGLVVVFNGLYGIKFHGLHEASRRGQGRTGKPIYWPSIPVSPRYSGLLAFPTLRSERSSIVNSGSCRTKTYLAL